MNTMPPDLRSQLDQSVASRRRAWAALQDIRRIIGKAAVVELPPVKRPPRFDDEGRVLANGLEQTLRKIETAIAELNEAIEAARPFLNSNSRGDFPQVHLRLNRALSHARELLPLVT